MALFVNVVHKSVVVRDLEVKHMSEEHDLCLLPFFGVSLLVNVDARLVCWVQHFKSLVNHELELSLAVLLVLVTPFRL